MLLSEFPVPKNNNSFGFHHFPWQCMDIKDKSYSWHYDHLKDMKDMGATWLSMISSPGGDGGYTPGNPACSELTFEISNDLEMGNIVRTYNSGVPPYFTYDVEVLLNRLVDIASGVPFYVKFNNEIDAEWKSATGHHITYEEAKMCCHSIANAIDHTWDLYNGLVIPSFLNVGYGGSGFNFFAIMHEIGKGDYLDRCWIPGHPYNGAWLKDWPWNETLLNPILLTREEYESYEDYAWSKGTGAVQTLEFVNEARQQSHNQRMGLITTQDLIDTYAYGFFTYKWMLYMLDELGHTEAPVLFPEWGTRVGETVPGLPAISPQRHMDYTLWMIKQMMLNPRILGGGTWFYNGYGTQTNWLDQAWIGPVWDIENHQNMPESWKTEIKTWGQLPIIDELRENPVALGKDEAMNKLGVHIQRESGDVLPVIREIQAPVNKTMDLSPSWCQLMKETSPDSLLVGRAFVDNQGRYLTDPQNLIDEMLNKYAPAIEFLDVIEVVNEEVNNHSTDEEIAAFDEYQRTFAHQAWALWPDIKIGLFQLATGNFSVEDEPSLVDFPLSMALPIDKVFICLHAYYYPDMTQSAEWYVLRYKTIMKDYPNHKFMLTEVGQTSAVHDGLPDKGWRQHNDRSLYIGNLIWLNQEIIKDVNCVGATVFNCGPSWGWETFESGGEVGEAVRMLPIIDIPPPPAIVEPISVKMTDGTIHIIELEEYLKGVVPAEMPALWPMESLKAQAVASRTYAEYMIDNPASPHYDITAQESHQVYNPALEHVRTNQAILETAGEVVSGMGEYVKFCGRDDCPYCHGENGTNGQQWPTRMCQYGAKFMGEQGRTYKEILYHYYYPEIAETIINNTNPYGVSIVPLTGLPTGTTYFQLIKAYHLAPDENGAWPGNHNLYLEVLDENDNRMYGEELRMWWYNEDGSLGGEIFPTIEKPPSEYYGADVPLWKGQVVSVSMRNVYSDYAENIHTGHPDEGGSNNLWHHSFFFVFKRRVVGEEPPVPPPPPEDTDFEDIRNRMWQELGIPYYPEAALQKYARENNLGAPLSDEIYYMGVVEQAFAVKWLWCLEGDWDNIKAEGY